MSVEMATDIARAMVEIITGRDLRILDGKTQVFRQDDPSLLTVGIELRMVPAFKYRALEGYDTVSVTMGPSPEITCNGHLDLELFSDSTCKFWVVKSGRFDLGNGIHWATLHSYRTLLDGTPTASVDLVREPEPEDDDIGRWREMMGSDR